MRVLRLGLRGFRSHERFDLGPGSSLTVIAGPNGSGKTNILEALHFGLTGRSCRTAMDRQAIAWESETAFVEVEWEQDSAVHTLKTALARSGEKKIQLDGSSLEQALPSTRRPAAVVFLPDRLNLVTGAPGERRKHFDRLIAELDQDYTQIRTAYTETLVQRNSLLASARAAGGAPSSLDSWDRRLADLGSKVVAARDAVISSIEETLAGVASELGFQGELVLRHRAAGASDTEEFLEGLRERLAADIERGYTSYGPHRADFVLSRAGREIKTTGSQGEKRMALLALLLVERELLADRAGVPPVLLLDDVMSELDAARRRRLVERVSGAGQCVITATEFEHVPVEGIDGVVRIELGGSHEDREGALAA